MNNSQFWGSNNASSTPKKNPATNNSFDFKKNVSRKKLGVTGIVLLVIVAILGILFYSFIFRPGLALYKSGMVLKEDAVQIGAALKARDLVELDKVLVETQGDLVKARESRDKNFGWAKNVKLFKLSEYYSDTDHFIDAGNDAIAALQETEKVILPFADAAGLKVSADQAAPSQDQGLMQAFQTWISIMPEVAGQMDGVIAKVSKVGDDLQQVNVDKYPVSIGNVAIRENIKFVKDTLSKADDYAPDVKQALTIFPRLLAVGTPIKRYMVVMQNDKEIRPTGGFMTNYATFRIDNGLLVNQDIESKDMYSVDLTLDAIDATYDFPDPPLAYGKYLKVERWYARDMNAYPDFQKSMDQFLIYYNMAGRIDPISVKPVDGIVSIDTQVISELLDVTGPVTVNGVTYTKDNVVLELERIASLALQEQAGRKRVLGYLMKEMLKNVFESDKNLWSKLIEKGIDLSVRRHIQFYMINDAEAQALANKYNVGGAVKQDVAGDYSMVVSTNLGADKTNWFVSKTINHSLEKSNGKWLHAINISYTYTQPTDDYAPFVKQFKDWVRVYAPAGSEFVSVDGSEDGTMTDQESGKVWFSGYITLQPGETKQITFKYYIPDTVVGAKNYDLYIQKQSGIDQEKHTVTVGGKTTTLDLKTDKEVNIAL